MDDDTGHVAPDALPANVEATLAAESPMLLPLAVLETVLLRSGSWGVTEVAKALGLPKARIHRHLANLRDAGFLWQNPTSRRYEPGWRLVALGRRIQATAQVARLLSPVMTELRDRIGQTVVLSALTADGVGVTDVLPGGSPIDVILHPGTVFQYNSSAQGKVALAFASPRQLALWSPLITERRTPNTVLDPTRLWSEVKAARAQGWADGPEETFLGVNAIAAPVFDHTGEIVYALAVVGSIHYIVNPPPPELIDAVRLAAADLSEQLGQDQSTGRASTSELS